MKLKVTKMPDDNYQLKLRMEQVNEIKGHQDARPQLPAQTQDEAGK
jgi:hypothetical protein